MFASVARAASVSRLVVVKARNFTLRSQFWRWTTQPRPSWRESGKEAGILFVVFGITGTASVTLVRPALKNTVGLEGSLKDGPWSYRIGSLLLVSPVYACVFLGVGTLAGRHNYAARMFQRIMGRFLPGRVSSMLSCPEGKAAAITRASASSSSSTRMAAAAGASTPPTGNPIGAKLLQVVQSTPVVIFSSPTCPFCKAAKESLDAEGIQYVDLAVKSEERLALKELTGQSSVPNIWIGGKFVGGYGDGPEEWMGLRKLLAAGTLHDMVDEAEAMHS
eukprot:CAMPEP_0184481428 /NCGR_PEP_ID=MMETSP0113_2-20130426/2971_1 /TAXON_ID=91329 /ORGANISM="Norrisiella sphaerica, Strain BC52" /LENGTH=276 /DNA_ID=CAMNT_0026860547 /DNA_START=69 /DNA_END=899 /DNA_ORIENTATION=-